MLTDRQNYFLASKLLMRKEVQQTSSHKSCWPQCLLLLCNKCAVKTVLGVMH